MALNTDKIIEELNDLIRFDHDAVGAYDQAIDALEVPAIREQLVAFRGDHLRHITDLSAAVQRLGGKPPGKPGARGVLRGLLTKVAGLVGDEAVLMAMRSNEGMLNKQYAERAKLDFPADISALVTRNWQDEQRHLAFVEQCLRTRAWEQPLAPTP